MLRGQTNEFSNIAHILCIKSHNYIRDELLELHFSYPQFLYLGIEASHISGWQDSSDFPPQCFTVSITRSHLKTH